MNILRSFLHKPENGLTEKGAEYGPHTKIVSHTGVTVKNRVLPPWERLMNARVSSGQEAQRSVGGGILP